MPHFFQQVCWKSRTLSAKVGSTKPAVIFNATSFQQQVLLATSDNFLLFECAHFPNLLIGGLLPPALATQAVKLSAGGTLGKLFKLLNLKSMAS